MEKRRIIERSINKISKGSRTSQVRILWCSLNKTQKQEETDKHSKDRKADYSYTSLYTTSNSTRKRWRKHGQKYRMIHIYIYIVIYISISVWNQLSYSVSRDLINHSDDIKLFPYNKLSLILLNENNSVSMYLDQSKAY